LETSDKKDWNLFINYVIMTTEVVMMRIASIKEFRDKATVMFRSPEPVLITKRGKVAGFYFPLQAESIPIELRKNLQIAIADIVKKSIEKEGLTEEDILEDFEDFRSNSS